MEHFLPLKLTDTNKNRDLALYIHFCYDYSSKFFREVFMAEHIMHKKETKKAPQKTLKEKREDKKNKKKGKDSD